MNGRQAAKLAARRIEELEDFNRRAVHDIKAYNRIILGMISGEIKACDWCEESNDCQLPEKADGNGCSEWWLAYNLPAIQEGGAEPDDSKGILSAGPAGGD